jgi:MarR family transcriptional regulator, 2-MHQ and catechol-resistance regulon repressor
LAKPYLYVKIYYNKILYGGNLRRMATRASGVPKTEATQVFLVLWKTYRAILAKAEESHKNVGLGDSDFRVLEALLREGPLPVNVIGEKVELTTGSITTAIDRMEGKWLVVRKNHPEDRRVRLVELTAKGRRLIEKAYARHALDIERAMSGLSRDERAELVDLLGRLGKASEDPAVPSMRAVR